MANFGVDLELHPFKGDVEAIRDEATQRLYSRILATRLPSGDKVSGCLPPRRQAEAVVGSWSRGGAGTRAAGARIHGGGQRQLLTRLLPARPPPVCRLAAACVGSLCLGSSATTATGRRRQRWHGTCLVARWLWRRRTSQPCACSSRWEEGGLPPIISAAVGNGSGDLSYNPGPLPCDMGL